MRYTRAQGKHIISALKPVIILKGIVQTLHENFPGFNSSFFCISSHFLLLKLKPLLPEELQTNIHHFDVIEYAFVLLNFLKGCVYTLGRPVRPV